MSDEEEEAAAEEEEHAQVQHELQVLNALIEKGNKLKRKLFQGRVYIAHI